MKTQFNPGVARLTVVATCLWLLFGSTALAQDDMPDPEKMMRKMQEHATPGTAHKIFDKLIGKWKTETTMMGGGPSAGNAEFQWILGNRYVQQTFDGKMMDMPFQGMGLMGYDNYKKKYTATWVDSISTTKNDMEGMLDRSGKIINFYGTMDEYLTGEHDKPVKYVLDLSQDDTILFEVHDLAIGTDSMVVQIRYTRVDEAADSNND